MSVLVTYSYDYAQWLGAGGIAGFNLISFPDWYLQSLVIKGRGFAPASSLNKNLLLQYTSGAFDNHTITCGVQYSDAAPPNNSPIILNTQFTLLSMPSVNVHILNGLIASFNPAVSELNAPNFNLTFSMVIG